jgi:quercetin dioxygenase-like cupin family protein
MRCYINFLAYISYLIVGTFVFQASCYAQDAGTVVILPQEIKYKATGSGAETAVLYGDPTKAGLYVMRLKLPAGAKVLPHIHPEEVRTLTVISGTLYFGFGEKWDESKLKAYPAGTFFSEVPTTPHFVAAKDGDVIFQATGIGPSGFVSKHE